MGPAMATRGKAAQAQDVRSEATLGKCPSGAWHGPGVQGAYEDPKK